MPPVAQVDDMPKTQITLGHWLAPQSAYHSTLPHVTSWMESSVPPALSGLVYAKLGNTAWQRFFDFSRWPDGWAGVHSQSIAWGTYRNFERFLDAARFATSQIPPSLFLTDEGHIELSWNARNGSAISVTLTPAGADYFVESQSEEQSVQTDGIEALAGRLNQAA